MIEWEERIRQTASFFKIWKAMVDKTNGKTSKSTETVSEALERKDLKEVVIPKERAVFWMDKNGRWYNEHGRFGLRKIVRRFNASIEKDEQGYYVTQINGQVREKVYFPYEDTVLFAIDIEKKAEIILRLNTGRRLKLAPADLSIENDSLYMHLGDERIKFSDRSLVKMSDLIEYNEGRYSLRIGNEAYPIRNLDS
ncbi:MAG: MFS transporter permease [Proteobacteria bacterium]|nr:MFS transporter permease [Pseudomonadota bacterium]